MDLLSIHLYLFLSLAYSTLSLSISLSIQIHAYLFKSRFLSLSILHISTYICFYFLSIHLYFLIPLCQSRLISISFYLFANSNSRLTFSFISVYSLYIHLYLFLSLVYPPQFLNTSLQILIDAYLFISFCQSKFTPISFNALFFISVYSSYIHLYLFLSLVYTPQFLNTSLSIQIGTYLFLSLC